MVRVNKSLQWNHTNIPVSSSFYNGKERREKQPKMCLWRTKSEIELVAEGFWMIFEKDLERRSNISTAWSDGESMESLIVAEKHTIAFNGS